MNPTERVGTCDGCKGRAPEPGPCCRLMILEEPWLAIKEGENDFLRWLLSHEGVTVNGSSVIYSVRSRCRWLTDGGDCSIYENRPELCRAWPYDTSCLEHTPTCAYRFAEGEDEP